VKRAEGIVEILEAFDLTGSYRAAAELAGCSHHTVARYVRLRAVGRTLTERAARDRLIDGYLAKVEEWVERSRRKVRADVVHDKLLALGFDGSERTTRRAVARAKRAYAAGHRRVYRPWIPGPGMWLQFDWGQGPRSSRRDSRRRPVDRLLHHAHVIITEGRSHRLTDALEGRGVTPLDPR